MKKLATINQKGGHYRGYLFHLSHKALFSTLLLVGILLYQTGTMPILKNIVSIVHKKNRRLFMYGNFARQFTSTAVLVNVKFFTEWISHYALILK